MDSKLVDWLLDSDPALRWQVERDLLEAPSSVWQATQARVVSEGFGSALLSLQDEDGRWAGGAFFPSDFDFNGPEAAPGAGQPWTATTWSLNSLREWGVQAAVLGETAGRLSRSCFWEYDDLPYWAGEVDCCINGFTLANGVWLGADVHGIAQWFVEHELEEGGWNCEWIEGSKRASVTSTLNSIRGILAYEQAGHVFPELHAARKRAEEYLLRRRLMYRLTDNSVVQPWVTRLAYPFRSFYNVLNVMDYFRLARQFDAAGIDDCMQSAVEEIKRQQQPDGTWLQARRHPGRVWFEVDVDAGEPSKWLTMHALRVLKWWEQFA